MKNCFTIAFVLGTRPEIIKCAPLIAQIEKEPGIKPLIIFSGQHKELAEQIFKTFNITPDVNLELMKENQSPALLLSSAINGLEKTLGYSKISACLVQGDTTTALAGALSAFHLKIPVIHLEAGLRTHTPYSPFPEEMNRSLISRIADIHLCPTPLAAENIKKEGINKNIFITGNTVVDAALNIDKKIYKGEIEISSELAEILSKYKRTVLITGHRRENFNDPMKNLCKAILSLSENFFDIGFIYPVHPNPNVKKTIETHLSNKTNINVIDPLDYPDLIHLIKKSDLVITDSGGIQEEAPSFGTQVIVTRESTERPEALECGAAILCKLENELDLIEHAKNLLENENQPQVTNPFGDGKASEKIVEIIRSHYC